MSLIAIVPAVLLARSERRRASVEDVPVPVA
jgi:hypothetical protein